jgi:AbrB family looped-hinge helix DNA binding protein
MARHSHTQDIHKDATEQPTRSRVTRPSAVTSKGQATIPAEIRRQAKIAPGDMVRFFVDGDRVVMEKVQEVDALWNAGQSAMMSEWNDSELDIYNE